MKTIVTSTKPFGPGDVEGLEYLLELPTSIHPENPAKVVIRGSAKRKVSLLGIKALSATEIK